VMSRAKARKPTPIWGAAMPTLWLLARMVSSRSWARAWAASSNTSMGAAGRLRTASGRMTTGGVMSAAEEVGLGGVHRAVASELGGHRFEIRLYRASVDPFPQGHIAQHRVHRPRRIADDPGGEVF